MSRRPRSLLAALERVRATYWFLPALLTIGAVVLSVVLTAVDRRVTELTVWLAWAYGGGADGARALLSAVAGSMLTVVSVTFSVMVVALTVSSQHFGPRLLRTFMRDRPAQYVLGTFTGAFAYCLLVLRTVQGDGGDVYERFIPHTAVAGAVVLALIAVGALIYYVHHIAVSMQVSEITRRIARELEHAIEYLYPDPIGSGADPREQQPPAPPHDAQQVRASDNGYVQEVDDEAMLRLAGDRDMTIWLQASPGDFVTRGDVIAVLSPRRGDPGACAAAVNGAYLLGSERSVQQDAGFAVQQLVEIALRALSPGTNEPFTAITAVDWLGAALVTLAQRRLPAATRTDASGRARIITAPRTCAALMQAAFEPIALHAGGEPAVLDRLLDALARLAAVAQREEDRQAIAELTRTVWTAAARGIEDGPRRTSVADRCARVQRALATTRYRPRLSGK